ncbi:lipopolysaccharide biosynthesis protein [Bacillus luti]|uniref:lipopolysaccharide biosynthesis protein n=1 Tax=Bacillus luti TaxID=2026191 RepID=UPI00377273BB
MELEKIVTLKKSFSMKNSVLLNKIISFLPGTLIPAVFSMLSIVIFTRVLTGKEYGVYSLLLSVLNLAMAVGSQWLQQSINKYLSVNMDKKTSILYKTVISKLCIILSLLVFIITICVIWSPVLNNWELPVILTMGFTLTNMLLFNICMSILQAELKSRIFSFYKMVNALITFVTSIVLMSLFGNKGIMLILGLGISQFLTIPFLWRKCGLLFNGNPLQFKEKQYSILKEFFVYGFPMIGWFISALILNIGDRYVIEYYNGKHDLGIYSANYNLIQGSVGLLAAPVMLAAHPFLMKAWGEGDESATKKWLASIVNWYFLIGILIVSAIWLFSGDIANLFLGKEFREGNKIMSVIVAGFLFWQLGMYSHKPLEFKGKTKLLFLLSFVVAILNVILNVVYVPIYGYSAAAYTTLISFIIYFLMTFFMGRKLVKWSIDFTAISKQAIGIVITVLILDNVRDTVQLYLGYGYTLAIYLMFILIIFGYIMLQNTKKYLLK